MNADLIGAVTAVYIYTTSIVLFAARMGGNARAALLSGIAFLLSAIPLGYLIISAPGLHRSPLYFVQRAKTGL